MYGASEKTCGCRIHINANGSDFEVYRSASKLTGTPTSPASKGSKIEQLWSVENVVVVVGTGATKDWKRSVLRL